MKTFSFAAPALAHRRRSRFPPRRPAASARSACRSMSRRSGPTRSRAAARRHAGGDQDVDYIVDQFQGGGLQPGGDLVNGKRKWTQAVPLLQSDSPAAPQVSLQSCRPGSCRWRRARRSPCARRPTARRPMTIDDAPLVFVGYGVKAPERGWDDFKGQDLRGKIIVVLVNDPDFEGGEGDFGGKAMTYYGRWTYKYEEGARQGADGRPGRPRDRAGLLRLEHGQEFEHQHHVRHRPQEPGGEHHAARRLDPARPRGADVRGVRASTSSDEGGRQKRKDFQPVAAQGDAQRHGDAKTEVDHVAQRRRHRCRARRIRTRR